VLSEIKESLAHLSSWMAPHKVSTPLWNGKGLSSSFILQQPLGVVLIIAPWNYPFNLLIAPLVGAIAAGNCVVLKPSDISVHTGALIAELIPKYLDSKCIKVIEGGVLETTELLKQKFDHIFYTGNTVVGKVVMKAAAEHLCPVTLELGGKNPVFVDDNIDLEVTAKRIAWAKTYNAGQSCLSADYIIVKKSMEEKLIQQIIHCWKEYYGEDPKKSPDYGRIVSKRHVKRIQGLLSDVDPKDIVVGGQFDEEDLYIAPTIIRNVKLSAESKAMQEEIFGPLLPIIAVENFQEAMTFVNSQPHPLGLYLFTKSSSLKDQILEGTISGGAVVNDVMVHFAQSTLPFGGVGESGMGSYHGKKTFLTFSHERSVIDKTTWMDMDFRYPPYNDSKLKTVKMFL